MSDIFPFPVVVSAYVNVTTAPVKSIVSPWLYVAFVGSEDILTPVISFDKFTVNVSVNLSPFVALSASLSSYSTVKLCVVAALEYAVVTMLSANAVGEPAPAFAYVTVYLMLLLLITSANVSPNVPLAGFGDTAIPVT